MEVIEKEVSTKQKIYQLSEQEYNDLQKQYNEKYFKGINDCLEYICFCVANSGLVANLSFCGEILDRLYDFIVSKHYYMENKYKMSMREYVNKYRS